MLIHKLCKNGDVDGLSKLLKSNCNINAKDIDGNTGLIEACYFGHKEIVSILIKAKCDLNIQNQSGYTGLMDACYKNHKDIIVELVRYGCKIDEYSRNRCPNEINIGLELRTQLFDTCIRHILKNMDEFKNKIHLLPRDIRKHLENKN